MDKWRGKVAVVTGASSGIGASLVRSLVEAGMLVVGLARRADAIEVSSVRKFTPYTHFGFCLFVGMLSQISQLICTRFLFECIIVYACAPITSIYIFVNDADGWQRR